MGVKARTQIYQFLFILHIDLKVMTLHSFWWSRSKLAFTFILSFVVENLWARRV